MIARPLGGLNDCLCQIEYCRDIAIATGRRLGIQTESGNPNLKHRFGQTFDSIFEFVDSTPYIANTHWRALIQGAKTIYPSLYGFPGNLENGPLSLLSGGKAWRFKLNPVGGEDAEILVHENLAGGLRSSRLLTRIAVRSDLMRVVSQAAERIPLNATGIHFRNSDYKSNPHLLMSFIDRVSINSPILLATDDQSIISTLRKGYPSKLFLSAGDLVRVQRSLTLTENAIVEIMALALCKSFTTVPLSLEHKARYSGFGRLARQLWLVRKLRESGWISTAIELRLFVGLGRSPKLRKVVASRLGVYNLGLLLEQAKKPTGVYAQLIDLRQERPN